jgi:putative peptide zinc metalloprotease protein
MNALKVRMRPDLVVAAQGTDAQRQWLVHDPVTLQFYRLRDEECSLLRMLDGRSSSEEIRQKFERQFAPLRLGAQQLQAFLYRLHEFGLILGDSPGQGDVLCRRMKSQRQNSFLSGFSNPLAIRLPGISARPIVETLYPLVHWMFSPTATVLWLLLVASALVLLLVELGTVKSRLPDFASFFNVSTASWFAVALIGTKALHELGHALACRHFGARCREFGVMLLLFMPTLYCDVSDAWRLSSKWQRIWVSAAGMLVELVLASIATWIWWLTAPGPLNAVALRIMFLCSVSTLIFNINPLLRYDGYYILSDWLEIPNLWQESRSLWRRYATSWFTKTPLTHDPTIPSRMVPALLLYAVLSAAYGSLLLVAMLWLCWSVLEPQGLGSLALGFIIFTLSGMVFAPAYSTIQRWSRPSAGPGIHRGRASLAVLVLLALVAALAFIPVPHRIAAPAWLEAEEAQSVYVFVEGTVQDTTQPASTVAPGDTLARLANRELDLRVAMLTNEVSQEQLRLNNLKLLLNDDPTVAPLVPPAEKSLEDAQDRLQQARTDQARLVLKAPRAGTVIPPPVAPPTNDSRRLASWNGTPLDDNNRGCFLETGTLFCQIGDPSQVEAMLIIEQSEVPFVQIGQPVRLRIDQGPVHIVTGTISELAKSDARDIPPPLARALDLPLRQDGKMGPRAAATYYQARVTLEPTPSPLTVGMHGQAKILADWAPLGTRLLRWLQLAFRV